MKNELVELNDGRFQKIWKYAEVVAAIMKEEENRNQLSAKGVHLRFGSSGISFVSVNRESPQMGVSGEDETKTIKCRTEKDLKKKLNECLVAEKPERPTPEKKLQSFLIRTSPFCNEFGSYMRRMVELEDGVANKLGIPSKIYFITDELAVMRNRNGAKRVCDLLAMRVDAEGKCIPMLIELKSDRLKSELTTQSKSYSEAFEILEQHLQGFSKIYSKLSGQTVEFVEPRLEPWIIWPFRSDKAAKKEIGKNINVIEYDDNGDGGYSFI